MDFYCAEHRLVVELDGGVHKEQELYDQERTAWLAERGYRVLRFTNEQIFADIQTVLKQIAAACQAPNPGPSPTGGGRA